MDRVIANLPVVTGPAWPGVRYFCTTRAGGVGVAPHDTLNLGLRAGDDPATVAENRRRVRAAVPADPLWLRQVHGSEVVDADSPDLPDEPALDASVTSQPGRVLAIMVADCLPVVIADAHGKVLGAAHAGWRGLAGGVLEHTLAAMRAKAPAAAGWRAWVGPGIGPQAFEVGQDVLDAFTADDPATARYFTPRPGLPGKWLADLAGLADFRLRRAGVKEVSLSGMCTVSQAQRFFSYRRDTETGRMALLAWLDPV
ncbi:peptidoglycan editing factor PgeF [Achromobacter spanius]|uniref:peptidoglycan editing factor PgeF n=1 Tax=Achromobacter TaxID=222 RepID=UPI001E5CDB81|nr:MULTISPECIES: peptidoglycan editing factor PgeF [Achromobacter]MCD0496188.1 peptidoglycan editing factor PgeF [Achromobacter sp. MY14]MCW3153052.1 peptidoglycan editing factor PgeF [Achromobacter spanius]